MTLPLTISLCLPMKPSLQRSQPLILPFFPKNLSAILPRLPRSSAQLLQAHQMNLTRLMKNLWKKWSLSACIFLTKAFHLPQILSLSLMAPSSSATILAILRFLQYLRGRLLALVMSVGHRTVATTSSARTSSFFCAAERHLAGSSALLCFAPTASQKHSFACPSC
jgi:hypothetical protein